MLCTKQQIAVNAAQEFDLCMPKTDDEWDEINHGFKAKTTNEFIAVVLVH